VDEISAPFSNTLPTREIYALLSDYGVIIDKDLYFLVSVALAVEVRSGMHQRTYSSLRLALEINRVAGHKVNTEQLAVATLAHDFSMGFLPLNILQKQGDLSAKDRKLMRTHINSAADLVYRMGHWGEAREMILAHHEHVDGSGYPRQLTENEICPGAKILAIVDTFTAQGSENIMHGVMEINRHGGTHFSSSWLDHFNTSVRNFYNPSA
jgi:HD-GYP domain-containing protein (c-di-GMP phosphodiesterase class II)